MRGEHAMAEGQITADEGSSPHARGAQHAAFEAYKAEGIIPACAGSTSSASSPLRLAMDHPRMRGEHLYKA